MATKDRLSTAKAALIRALEITEKLLSGFPIPGAKGTIEAVLDIIKEAEVCAEIQPRVSSSQSPLQRTATNATLCNEVRVHIQRLYDELLWPLDGRPIEDIPEDTRAAVERYTEYVSIVSFGNRCLINDYRSIGLGLQQLSQPKADEYGRFRRWIHSKDLEVDIRKVLDLLQLSTRAYAVSFARDGERIVCSHV